MLQVFAGVAVLGSTGCLEDPEAVDPGAIVREEIAERAAPPAVDSSRNVRCLCDAEGGLHVQAPPGSSIAHLEGEDAAVDITPPEEGPRPIRTTRSLGFIGDNPLGGGRSHRGR